MKISFIMSTLWLSGGVRDIIEFANGLNRRGHDITIVVPGGTIQKDFQELDTRISILETRFKLPENPIRAKRIDLARISWSLAALTPKSDFIISTHTPTTIAGLIATRLYRHGRPIWFYQDYLEMFDGRLIETWLVRHAMRWHQHALVLSTSSKEELNSFFPCEVTVVRVGLSHKDVFQPLSVPPPAEKKGIKNILFLGDMRPRKGLYDFLDAARIVRAEIPDIHLWIVSKDDCQIETSVSYEFIHRPSRRKLAEMFATCDLFVSASWWESFGIPPLEAMACGAPVVLTDSRGVREYAKHEVNCLMTPVKDPQALAQAMIRVLTDHELAAKFRENGLITAKKFTWEASVDRFEQALQDIHLAANKT